MLLFLAYFYTLSRFLDIEGTCKRIWRVMDLKRLEIEISMCISF
jgi:hypothetical protein